TGFLTCLYPFRSILATRNQNRGQKRESQCLPWGRHSGSFSLFIAPNIASSSGKYPMMWMALKTHLSTVAKRNNENKTFSIHVTQPLQNTGEKACGCQPTGQSLAQPQDSRMPIYLLVVPKR